MLKPYECKESPTVLFTNAPVNGKIDTFGWLNTPANSTNTSCNVHNLTGILLLLIAKSFDLNRCCELVSMFLIVFLNFVVGIKLKI
jgi:hypothetical protein